MGSYLFSILEIQKMILDPKLLQLLSPVIQFTFILFSSPLSSSYYILFLPSESTYIYVETNMNVVPYFYLLQTNLLRNFIQTTIYLNIDFSMTILINQFHMNILGVRYFCTNISITCSWVPYEQKILNTFFSVPNNSFEISVFKVFFAMRILTSRKS